MKANITIDKVATITELPNYWSNEDFSNLLKQFDVPISATLTQAEQIEYLQMAVSELSPNEAAQIVLTYKLAAYLSENQIHQISNDMLIDKISEEYPEINLHKELFSVNQLLFKLYNGKFLNTKATSVQLTIEVEGYSEPLTPAEVLKLLLQLVADSNVIKRLFGEELDPKMPFEQANDIIWEFSNNGDQYSIITSEYWLADQEIKASSHETEFEPIVLSDIENE